MDNVKHCVRPVDTTDRRIAIILRRVCDDAPVLKPVSDGCSLRNYDRKMHNKVKYRCEKMVEIKRKPYMREFTVLESDKTETNAEKYEKREKVREPWRKRQRIKKSSKSSKNEIGTFKLDKDQITNDGDDVKWNFGASPTRQRTSWSSDEENEKSTKNAEKTNDITDLIYDFANRRSNSREREIKEHDNITHMKKSRKRRGREFREKINAKFGFRPSVVQSGTESDSDLDIGEIKTKKDRISKFTF